MQRNNFLILFILFSCFSANAQTTLFYTGYGRALLTSNHFEKESPFVKNDTVSRKRSLNGNFVFDLGVNVKPNENFKAGAILRVSNQFGGFFSTGSLLEFRQVQIQGILAKKVLFNLGDIDLGLTKYTLYNFNEPTYSRFEATPFRLYRDIVHYENFNNGNLWRLQGLQASSTLKFTKVIESIQFNGIGTRIKPSNFLSTPDRLLYGGSVTVKQSRFLDAGINFIGISDIPGTLQDSVVFYDNKVLTGTINASANSKFINLSLNSEFGNSFSKFSKFQPDTVTISANDAFFDAGLKASHRYIPISLKVSYRRIGPYFSSPGAQTRRIYDNKVPSLLPEGGSGTLFRNQTVFDRLSDPNSYNRSLSATLMLYNPLYSNVLPYGPATPNRKGITAEASYGNTDSLLFVEVNVQQLSEVIGVGLKEIRKFSVINAGGLVNINKALHMNRLFFATANWRMEKTEGAENAGISLTSTFVDGGLTIETLDKLDLTGGIKFFSATGKEYIILRNEVNQITEYSQFTADNKQTVTTFGLRYRFTNQIYASVSTFRINNKDKANTNMPYKLNQYFFNFIMRF